MVCGGTCREGFVDAREVTHGETDSLSRGLVTSATRLVASRAILRFVVVGCEVRTTVQWSLTHAAEVRAMLDTRGVQHGTRVYRFRPRASELVDVTT
jgi:hypothetical protein